MLDSDFTSLIAEITRCMHCAPMLASGPRPIVQLSATAKILIIGQAPGVKVHVSGIPWDDDSGKRLREWTGIPDAVFYDPAKVALMPMGFCYPGKGKSGDNPPRPECAPLWHQTIIDLLPTDRLTLLVGSYAQARYMEMPATGAMTEVVRCFNQAPAGLFPLPHPSWRSVGWMRKNPWFETTVLPKLRSAVSSRLV